MNGPLQGLRVLELGQLIAAPFAARILAEFGADVIKVESPAGGDPLRKWRKMHGDTSLWWSLQSRNKKSVAIDLKSPEGLEVVRRLAQRADVVIENFRPGGLEKLGLGWDVLSALNPKLVMVRISGYGQTGPYRDRPGFGAIGESMGGIRFTTGDPKSPPARVGISIGDTLASLHGVIGALMALLHVRSQQGEGQIVDVSLVESVFNVMESIIPEYDLLGEIRTRTGGALPGITPSNTYPAKDGGFVVIAGNSDAIFRRLMAVIGRADLANNPDLRSNDGRSQQAAMLDEAITSWTRTCTVGEAICALEAADVPASRIYSVEDIITDPHYIARDMILQAALPDGTPIRMPGIVPKLSTTPGTVRWQGPSLGEHTDAVLTNLGMTMAEIASLRAKGAVA